MNHCSMRSLAGFWILLLGWPALFHAAPVSSPVSPEDEVLAERFISRYSDDWLTNPSPRRISKRSFTENLKSMQSFYGLEVTGALNNETLELMKRPRCGVPDVSRYIHYEGRPKWLKKQITYRITRYTPDLTRLTADATIAQAFQLYSDVVPLDFKQIRSGTADIEIYFAAGEHGDFNSFDGKNGELAHAIHPQKGKGGFVHFDEDETWTVTNEDFNLLLVAAHEIGHSLGLEHSKDSSALLFPSYQYVDTNGYKLPDDDRRGIQALYGPREVPTPKPERPTEDPFPSPEDEQCNRTLVFDAATSFREDLFFFKNGYYWRKSSEGIDLTKVNSKWSEIYIVDAAYEVPHKNAVYLFEGAQYWGIKADSETVMSGYPQPLTNLGLPPSVTQVDAAVYESTTKKTFIFSGSQYWRYDDGSNQMDPGYPRDIKKDFPGIGSRVDAAFENYGNLFLSNGPRQSEYNLACRKVMRVLLNYGWLGCY
ncbi:collagenase 3-like [Cheilinus undulatus]|uniref:collagenase 3-like n=1 Tax=Cheilinus undulatus TaxID=241271 RepID=UPI001BD41CDA|nr:collagenase 3-like [Cheilinus undulatus]